MTFNSQTIKSSTCFSSCSVYNINGIQQTTVQYYSGIARNDSCN